MLKVTALSPSSFRSFVLLLLVSLVLSCSSSSYGVSAFVFVGKNYATSRPYSIGSGSSSSGGGGVASNNRQQSTNPIVVKGTESDLKFSDQLDGSQMRIGIIKARWNSEHVDNLVGGVKKALKDCNVDEVNIFETSVPGSFELPMAARFLALSGTVDAIVTVGVLIKGETMHFEYIADAVAKGIMNIGIQTSTPIIFGVLTCLNTKQVTARSTEPNNHGYDWGKSAVEMALLRTEAMGGKAADTPLKELGFGLTTATEKKLTQTEKEKVKPGFF